MRRGRQQWQVLSYETNESVSLLHHAAREAFSLHNSVEMSRAWQAWCHRMRLDRVLGDIHAILLRFTPDGAVCQAVWERGDSRRSASRAVGSQGVVLQWQRDKSVAMYRQLLWMAETVNLRRRCARAATARKDDLELALRSTSTALEEGSARQTRAYRRVGNVNFNARHGLLVLDFGEKDDTEQKTCRVLSRWQG